MAKAHDNVHVTVNVTVNVELARLLARAGWTPEDLGDRLNRLAASMGLRDHIHRKSVRRWVRAMPSCPIVGSPSEPWPALVCHLLQQRTGETVTPPRWDGARPGWGCVWCRPVTAWTNRGPGPERSTSGLR